VAEAGFLERACPSCGAAAPAAEVQSDPPAEKLSFNDLRPHWTGLFKRKVFFSYDRCGTCGLLFAPTFFTPTQLEDLYSAMEPNMPDVTNGALDATQRGYFDAAAGDVPLEGGYLEIGPDVGFIVRHAAREGKFDEFWLFEPNEAVHAALADATEGKPHHISTGMTDFSSVPDGSVGLAVMVHVLDHLLDPVETLRQVRAKLRPDGALMIVTHNEASLLRRVMGTRWPPFCLQHPEIYNPDSISALLRRAGFGKVEVQRSRNYFPIGFMIRQAAWTAGIKLDWMPLPNAALGLKLGNILTLAAA